MTTNTIQSETTMTIAWFKISADKNQKICYDTENALAEIIQLPTNPNAEPNRYWFKQSSNKALYVDNAQGRVSVGKAFTLHQVVKDKLPEVDDAGSRRDLNLGPTEGLVHTAVGLLVEDTLLGLAFTNAFKPPHSQLATYIRDKRQRRQSVKQGPVIRPLIHKDTLARLRTTGELTKASLTIEADAASILEAENHELFQSMRVALDQEPTTREIPIAWSPKDTTGFGQRVIDRVRPLLQNSRTRRHLKQMQGKVRVPDNEKLITINVLSDQLTESITVPNPNPQSARIAIPDVLSEMEQSYNRLEKAIEESVGAEMRYTVESQLRLI